MEKREIPLFSWEKKLFEWIHRNLFVIGAALLVLFSAALRWALVPFKSYDYIYCLEQWFVQLKNAGGILEGMRQEIGDYNHLYRFLLSLLTFAPNALVAIKSLSFVFDYAGAAAGGWLVCTALRQSGAQKQRAAAMGCISGLILLYLPVVLMNSAVWGQCDFMYVSFLVLCVVFLIREQDVPAFFCYGVALSFKLQAIFLLPVLILLYVLTKRFPFTHFLIIPGTMLVMGLPGIIARWPVSGALALLEPFMIYKEQITGYHSFTLNFPNIYSFLDMSALPEGRLESFFGYVRLAGTMFTLAVLGTALWYVLLKRPKANARLLILLCVFCVDTCVLFLPAMHERYGFCGTIFFTLYVILYRRLGVSLLARYITEACTYVFFLNENPINFSYPALAVVNLAAYVMVCLELYRLVCAASDTAVGATQKEERAEKPPAKRKRTAKRAK